VVLQVAHLLGQLRQIECHLWCAAGLGRDDLSLLPARGIAELDGDEALAGGVLQVLQCRLVARVVGQHQQEALRRLQHLAALLDVEQSPVVGQRVDQDRRVLARLDDLVEIADRAHFDGPGERTVDPAGLVTLEQVTTYQVGGGEILVAGDGDEGDAFFLAISHVAVKVPRHVLDETGLPTPRGTFEKHGNLLFIRGFEEFDLVPDGEVERLFGDAEVLDLVSLEPGCRSGLLGQGSSC
jgi:hypothetical protein